MPFTIIFFFQLLFSTASSLKRLAIVTGGARGIGSGITQALASSKEYTDILITYNTNLTAAEQFASQLRSQNKHLQSVEIIGGDICLPSTRDAIFKCVDNDFGDECELAVLVHNAGQYLGVTSENAHGLGAKSLCFGDGSLVRDGDNDDGGDDDGAGTTDLENMHYYQRLYGDAFVDLCERSIVRMKRARARREGYRGSLIGISSPGCNFNQRPSPGYDMPGSGKCVMEYAMRLFALRTADIGINCNVLIPGVTISDAWMKIAENMGKTREEFMESMVMRSVPMKCVLEPKDIGDVVKFLCSPEGGGRFVTGVSLSVDGGLHLGKR